MVSVISGSTVPLEDVLEFLHQSLVAVGHSDVGDIGPCDVVPSRSLFVVVYPQPVLFHLQ